MVFLVAKGFLAVEAKLLLETGFFPAPTVVGAPIAVLARLMAASLAFSSPFSLLRPFLGAMAGAAAVLEIADVVDRAILPGAASLDGRGVGIPLIVRKM
jgi:hypothetical protein